MDKAKLKGPFYQVFRRELDRMVSRRLYFGICIVVPLFCIFFMSTIFGSGQMENIPVGVVDLDQTTISRNIIRSSETVPTFKVVKHYPDLTAARDAVLKKEIYAYFVIPSNFQAHLLSGEDATIPYYFHYALLSVGVELDNAFKLFLANISIKPIVVAGQISGRSDSEMEDFLIPVSTQSHPLSNPSLDYSIYLTNPFFFVLLQIIILLLTIYILGIEIKFKTADDWLKAANGNMVIAVTAKLLPYTVIFITMGILANFVMFGILKIPYPGTFLELNLVTALFIIATQAFGTLIFSLFPAVSLIISLVSMIGSLGATLSGVTFPVPFMFPIIYHLSFLFPVRHFVEINQNILYGNYGFAYAWQNVSCLFIYMLLALLLLPHLKRAILSHKYENIE